MHAKRLRVAQSLARSRPYAPLPYAMYPSVHSTYPAYYFSGKDTSLVETRVICSPRGIACSSPCPCANVTSFRGCGVD